VQWIADRIVNAQGAVQHPGSFERSDNMHISDLLIRAGDVLPEAYREQAILFRLNDRLQIAEGIPVNLEAASQKDPASDLLLKDGDTLLVQRFNEVRWVPDREVTVTGAVQRPGTYPRLDEMRVSELIFQAGDLLPQTSKTALLLRRNERWEVAESFVIDLAGALEKDPQKDMTLQDGDNLIVYTEEERMWIPPREVSITGAVQLPGTYPRVDDMHIRDLLFQAGDVLPNAYLDRADLQRYLADQETLETIPVDLGKVRAGDPDADLLLQDRDTLIVSTIREAVYYPDRIVTIYGAVQRPDTYIRTEDMRVSDLLFAAGGVLPGAREAIEIARARGDEQTTIISVSLTEVEQGDPSHNILLDDQDLVTVPKKQEFRDVPLTVEIGGDTNYGSISC
jgi:protein involved in polysaccharide export with SLBB domain